MDTQTIIIAVISSGVVGSLLVFAQFLIQRHDSRQDKNREVLTAIRNLDAKITELDGKIDQVDAKVDQRSAVASRVRILRFADEMYEGRKHSKDAWDQVLLDCSEYEKFSKYCERNGIEFSNNITEETIKYLKDEYQERLKKHDFLIGGEQNETTQPAV